MTTKTTPEMSLLRADQAVLENLARAVQYRDKAAADVAKGGMHLAQAAQRAAEYGFQVEALLSVARASGAGIRHEGAVEVALEGNEDAVFEYFFNEREDLQAQQA